MTRDEKAVLKEAAAIITRELLAGRSPAVPGFGRFYTSRVEVYEGVCPMSDCGWDDHLLRPRLVPRFRAFGRLRAALKKKARQAYLQKKHAEDTRRT